MQALEHAAQVEKDFLPLNGTDHVEFYVGNARQAAYYYRAAFGFRLAAYRGPETGTRESASYVLVQNKIRLVFTTPLSPEHPAAGHVGLHGDGVRDVALWVDDAESAWRETTRRGARSVRQPETLRDAAGEARVAAIATYGDTIHTFVERRNYRGAFLPGGDVAARHPVQAAADLIGGGVELAAGGTAAYRPHGGQCGTGRNEPLGRLLPRRHGLPHVQTLRR